MAPLANSVANGILELSDLFAYFSIKDNKFSGNIAPIQQYISSKKEFTELETSIDDVLQDSEIPKVYKHQLLMRRLLLYLDEFLVIDDTGTGKTCNITIFIEMVYWIRMTYLETGIDRPYSHFKRALILVKGEAQRNQIIQQIVCVCSKGQYVTDNVKKSKDSKTQLSNITRAIEQWYTIMTFETFAALIEKIPCNDKGDQQIEDEYSDLMIWIDEAHLLRQKDTLRNWTLRTGYEDLNRRKERTYYSIWRVFHLAKRSKKIVTTATPAVYEPSDIRDPMNLILPANLQMPSDVEFYNLETKNKSSFVTDASRARFNKKVKNGEIEGISSDNVEEKYLEYIDQKYNTYLQKHTEYIDKQYSKYLDGRITYVRAADTGINITYEQNLDFPYHQRTMNDKDFPGNDEELSTEDYKSQVMLYQVKMSKFQTQYYNMTLNEETGTKNSLYTNSRAGANFVFPDGNIGVGYKKEEAFGKYITIGNDGDVDSAVKEKFIDTIENLEKYGCKVAEILRLIRKKKFESFFLTDRLVRSSGLAVVALALKNIEGYEFYDGSESMFESTDPNSSLSFCGSSGKKTIRSDIRKKKRYVMMTGKITKARFHNIMEIMSSFENRYGEYVQVFLGSDVTRVGFSINNIKNIVFFGGIWLEADRHQSESRSIRVISHQNLLKDLEMFYQEAEGVISEIIQEYVDDTIRVNSRDIKVEKIVRKGNFFFIFGTESNQPGSSDTDTGTENVIIAWEYIGERTYKDPKDRVRRFDRIFRYCKYISSEEYDWYMKRIPEEPRVPVSVYMMSSVPSNLTIKNKTTGKLMITKRIPYKLSNIIDEYMYLSGENKDRKIRKTMRLLKRFAVTCHIHRKRNIREGDVDGSKTCDYQSCQYTCASEFKEEEYGKDTSTYDIYFSEKVILATIDNIKEIFNSTPVASFDWIVSALNRNATNIHISEKFVLLSLAKMISDKIPIRDSYGVDSYLRENNGEFYLTDFPTNNNFNQEITLTDSNLSYYSYYHNFNSHTDIGNTDVISAAGDILISRLQEMDIGSEEYIETLKDLPVIAKERLLESVIYSYYIQGEKENKLNLDILERCKYIYYETFVPYDIIEDFEKSQTIVRRGRPLDWIKKKPKAKNDKELYSISIPNFGKKVYISTVGSMYGMENKTKFAQACNFMGCMGKIRILIEGENKWRDLNNFEKHAYNYLCQAILRLHKIREFRNQTVYGYILGFNENDFRIIIDPVNTNDDVEVVRDRNRGRICKDINEKFKILEMMYLAGYKRKEYDGEGKKPKQIREYIRKQYRVNKVKDINQLKEFDDSRLFYYYHFRFPSVSELRDKLKDYIIKKNNYFHVAY